MITTLAHSTCFLCQFAIKNGINEMKPPVKVLKCYLSYKDVCFLKLDRLFEAVFFRLALRRQSRFFNKSEIQRFKGRIHTQNRFCNEDRYHVYYMEIREIGQRIRICHKIRKPMSDDRRNRGACKCDFHLH